MARGDHYRGMSDTLVEFVRRRGGAAHTRTARAAGFTPHTMATAVREGRIERVRRSWLIHPECPVPRRDAAARGGRLTCVSAAAEMGLWVPAAGPLHIWIPPTASRVDATGVRLHRARGPVSLAPIEPDEHILNVLFHVASCLPPVDALAVWESALRRRVVDAEVLTRVVWRSPRATEVARAAGTLSDSGLESHFRALMAAAAIPMRQQVRIDGHHVDGLIGERLVVQLDGFAFHSTPADRRRDIEQDARLVLRGYTVLRFDYAQVIFEPETVLDHIRTAMAQGLHLAPHRPGPSRPEQDIA